MLQQKVQPVTWKESIVTQSSILAIQGNKTLSQQQIYATGRNSIATKKRMSQHSIDCCNKVKGLEEEISISTKDNHVAT